MFKFLIVLGVLVALWALVLYRAGTREAQAEQDFPPLGQIVDVDGHKVHALVLGDGPDLVLIHGSGGNIRDLMASVAPTLARDYRVILLERPGHGFTDRINTTGATLEQQARLLATAARQLGAQKPIVMGHSFGGAVALAWAVHEPGSIAGLIPLAAPSNLWTTGVDTFYHITAHPILGALANPVLAALVPESKVVSAVGGVFAPDPVPQGYLDTFGAPLTLRRESLRANALQRLALHDQIKALIPHYPAIAVPTEIVHGTADTTVSLPIHSALLVDQIPDAVLTPLDGIGHMPHHADPDAVIAAIHRVAQRAGLREPAE